MNPTECRDALTPEQFVAWIEDIRDVPGASISLAVQIVAHVCVRAERPTGTLRTSVGEPVREGPQMPPITMPELKTFNDRKTPVVLAPHYLDPADGLTKPDPTAVITASSSDPSVGVEKDGDGQWWITTPGESGAGEVTFHAESGIEGVRYDNDVVIPVTYQAPIAGELNVTIGAGVPDTPLPAA